jgi:3-oxoacyl-[acyl-carrier protein] reductase
MPQYGRELAGDVAIVTGAAHNIGRAICLALAEAGAAVCVNAITSGTDAAKLATEIESAGGRSMHFVGDITDGDAMAAMVNAVVERYGKLSILINNAGVRGNLRLNDLDLDEWLRVTRPTIEGTMICSKAAVPHMQTAGGGTIISLGGIASHTGVAGRTHVAAANAAIIGFMKSLAHEVGTDNIRVNTVVPGHIDTVRGPSAGPRPKTDIKFLIQDRLGRPEEVAAMVRALCGLAGAYVTGQTIHVNGGAYLP